MIVKLKEYIKDIGKELKTKEIKLKKFLTKGLRRLHHNT